MSRPPRDWSKLHADAARIALLEERRDRMQAFVKLVWSRMADTGISWIGFYEDTPGARDDERLVLTAREPKPACSPIGLHGACGQCLRSGSVLIVRDVRELGESYIACDPRDMSEIVLPCRDSAGSVWGVLDVDSHEIGAFSEADGAALGYLLRLAGVAL